MHNLTRGPPSLFLARVAKNIAKEGIKVFWSYLSFPDLLYFLPNVFTWVVSWNKIFIKLMLVFFKLQYLKFFIIKESFSKVCWKYRASKSEESLKFKKFKKFETVLHVWCKSKTNIWKLPTLDSKNFVIYFLFWNKRGLSLEIWVNTKSVKWKQCNIKLYYIILYHK